MGNSILNNFFNLFIFQLGGVVVVRPHGTEVAAPFQEGYGVLSSTLSYVVFAQECDDLFWNCLDASQGVFHTFIFIGNCSVEPNQQLLIPINMDSLLFSSPSFTFLLHLSLHIVYKPVKLSRLCFHDLAHNMPINIVTEILDHSFRFHNHVALLVILTDRVPKHSKGMPYPILHDILQFILTKSFVFGFE